MDARAHEPNKDGQDADDMPIDDDAFDQADKRAAHLARKPKIDKARAAIQSIQNMGDDAPDGMAAQLLVLTQQVTEYDQEGKDLASPKAKKNMLRLAHVKAARVCAAKKLEAEQCQKALEGHREAITVANAEIAKLEPVLKQLLEEQVQTTQAKDEALAAWTKAEGGEAKPVVAVAGATGSSPSQFSRRPNPKYWIGMLARMVWHFLECLRPPSATSARTSNIARPGQTNCRPSTIRLFRCRTCTFKGPRLLSRSI